MEVSTMSKIYYPAVFHIAEDVGGYWVEFPDLPGCFTQGSDDIEAISMAEDVLGLWLDRSGEDFQREILPPSAISEIKNRYPDDLVMMVGCDPEEFYRKRHNKAVKKTLTIPEWLNERANTAGLNFSQILKEALISKLNL